MIVALSVRGRDHIPYRSSKLTHVLKDSLGGNCKTLMVACIWGEAAQLEETTSTCRLQFLVTSCPILLLCLGKSHDDCVLTDIALAVPGQNYNCSQTAVGYTTPAHLPYCPCS